MVNSQRAAELQEAQKKGMRTHPRISLIYVTFNLSSWKHWLPTDRSREQCVPEESLNLVILNPEDGQKIAPDDSSALRESSLLGNNIHATIGAKYCDSRIVLNSHILWHQ